MNITPSPNSNFPLALDTFVDPTAGSPTTYGSSTDHAEEHAKENDALSVVEQALFGVSATIGSPGGLAKLDSFGRLPYAGFVPNLNLYSYGHSGVLTPGVRCSSGADVLTLTHERMDLQTTISYGVANSRLLDVYYDILGGFGGAVAGATWATPRPGVVVIDAEKGDAYNPTSATTWANMSTQLPKNYGQTLNAICALLSSTRVESSTASLTGTWTVNTGNYSGGSCISTTVQNATATYTVAAPTGTLYHLGYVTQSATGDTQISINGTVVGSATTSNTAGADVQFSTRTGTSITSTTPVPVVTAIRGLTPGTTYTVVVTKTDASTNPIYSDAILAPQSTAPMICVVADNLGSNANPTPTAPVTGWATQLSVAAVNKPLLDSQIATVVSQYPNAVSVSLGVLNPQDLSYVTGNDLNDRGMRKYSDLLTAAIAGYCLTVDSDGLYATL